MSRSDLERELGQLRQENTRLKKLLRLTKREVEPATGDQSAWFDRRPGPVAASSRADDKVTFVSAVFQARHDVYAVRSENRRRGTSGFVPAVGAAGVGTVDTTIRGISRSPRTSLQLTRRAPITSGSTRCFPAMKRAG